MAGRRDEIVAEIPHLRRYARALLRDPVAADDLVQACLERALGRFHLWRRGSRLRPWLFTIMHNLHVSDLRRQARRPREIEFSDLSMPLAQDTMQEVQVEARRAVAALTHLPDDQRAAVLLVALEQMTYAEAAEVLGIPQGTVMSRLHRGRERLRALMTQDGAPTIRRVK